jgi:hypothetical protein
VIKDDRALWYSALHALSRARSLLLSTRDRAVNKHGGSRKRVEAVAGHWTGTARVSARNGLFTAMQQRCSGMGAGSARAVAGGWERGEKRTMAASSNDRAATYLEQRNWMAGSGVGAFRVNIDLIERRQRGCDGAACGCPSLTVTSSPLVTVKSVAVGLGRRRVVLQRLQAPGDWAGRNTRCGSLGYNEALP